MRCLSVIPSCTPIYIRFEKGFGQNTFIYHGIRSIIDLQLSFVTSNSYTFLFVYFAFAMDLNIVCYTVTHYTKMCGIFALNCNFK